MIHFILQLHITGRCNLHCRHCYIDSHTKEMTLTDICRVLTQYDALLEKLRLQSREPVTAHLHITGGEPLTHKHIDSVLAILARKKKKYSMAFMSNGTLLTPQLLDKLKALDLKAFQLSLDGTPRTHDAIRGQSNHAAVVKAIELLRQWEIPVRVSFTANEENFREFPQVAQICREHGVSSLWSDRYVPFPCTEMPPLAKESTWEYLNLLQHEHDSWENLQAGLSVENFRALQFLTGNMMPYSCTAGEKLIAVDENGTIYPCRRLPIPCGNIRQTDLAAVYFGDSTFESLRRHSLDEGCHCCPHHERCKGGARCLSYAVTGNLYARDPGCPVGAE